MSDEKQEQSSGGGMKVDIGQISAAGHVVVAGRDAHVTGATRGDGNEKQVLTIGGVEASADEVQELRSLLQQLDQKIDAADLDVDAYDAAKRNATELKQQITSEKKPNEHLLVQATEGLLSFGPDIAGAVVAAFTTPLAGKITAFAGERALNLYRRLRGEAGESSVLTPEED